jgi:hypothetical protein
MHYIRFLDDMDHGGTFDEKEKRHVYARWTPSCWDKKTKALSI